MNFAIQYAQHEPIKKLLYQLESEGNPNGGNIGSLGSSKSHPPHHLATKTSPSLTYK